ncbi:hypothetical protein HGRIS_005780 [Hohenbuehelia grisea]|uniref:Uncharacterized protein n=1 Tax=Hohenbuehelia grisea TaxID=104357 RepID=A0ABR3JZS3_9AGAR
MVIVCKIPSSFKGHFLVQVTSDLAKFTYCTTIGPEQFRPWVLNRPNFKQPTKVVKNCPAKKVKNTGSEGGRPRVDRTTHSAVTRVSVSHVRDMYTVDEEMKKHVLLGVYSEFLKTSYEAWVKEKLEEAKLAAKVDAGINVKDERGWFEIIPKGGVRGTQAHLDMLRDMERKVFLRRREEEEKKAEELNKKAEELKRLKIEREIARQLERERADEKAGITQLPNGVILHCNKITFYA